MASMLLLLPGAFAVASALAPPVLPQAAPPVRGPATVPSAAGSAAVAPASGAYASALKAAAPVHAPRFAVQPLAVAPAADWKTTQAQLLEALSSVSPIKAAMYYESEMLRQPATRNGEPSIAALLDHLEGAKPAPAAFDRKTLVGDWRLSYTDQLPQAVRDEVARHIKDPVVDLSVIVSISEAGAMDTKAVVSLLGGESRVVKLHSSIVQQSLSPSFAVVNDDGERMLMDVTYSSDSVLVLRKQAEQLDQLLEANDLSKSSPKSDVWVKVGHSPIDLAASSGPTSLWRFGLEYDRIREAQFESGAWQNETAAALVSWSKAAGVCLLFAFFVAALKYSRWSRAHPKLAAATEMTSVDHAQTEPKLAVAAVAGESLEEGAREPQAAETDETSGWRASTVLSLVAALMISVFPPATEEAQAARSGGRMGGTARRAMPPPRSAPRSAPRSTNKTVVERNNTTVVMPPAVVAPPMGMGYGMGYGLFAPPTVGDIVVGAAVNGAVNGAIINSMHSGPSHTDRMIENQQRQDERQISQQQSQIESLQRELAELKAKK